MKRFLSSTAFSPFKESLFRTLWIAAFISNIGTWMQNVGVSWVAATLSTSPLIIALIQTASSLPSLPGVKMLGMKPVSMKTSSVDEFAGVLDGSYFGNKFDVTQAYGYVKYVSTMWTLSMARKYPDIKFVVMSPGNTGGTNAPDNLPPAMKFMLKYLMMPVVFPLMGGMVHKLEVGAKRFVDAISDDRYKSGVFYASKEGKLSGEVVDQSTFYVNLKINLFQDNADEAIHRFIK
jgi:hypothetical protein